MHAIAITPVGPLGAFVARLPQQRRPSPSSRRVGSHINLFEACSAFTARYGLHARQVPCRTLYTGSFNRFVTSTTVPIATGWNDSCRVGIAPTEKSRLPRRTGASDLFVNVRLGTEMHRFIVANLGNRTTIPRDLRLKICAFHPPICFVQNKSEAPKVFAPMGTHLRRCQTRPQNRCGGAAGGGHLQARRPNRDPPGHIEAYRLGRWVLGNANAQATRWLIMRTARRLSRANGGAIADDD